MGRKGNQRHRDKQRDGKTKASQNQKQRLEIGHRMWRDYRFIRESLATFRGTLEEVRLLIPSADRGFWSFLVSFVFSALSTFVGIPIVRNLQSSLDLVVRVL